MSPELIWQKTGSNLISSDGLWFIMYSKVYGWNPDGVATHGTVGVLYHRKSWQSPWIVMCYRDTFKLLQSKAESYLMDVEFIFDFQPDL